MNKKYAVAIIFIMFLFSIQVSISTENVILAGPYIQNLSSTGVTIMWITGDSTDENRVYWGINGLDNEIDGGEGGKIHEVTLSTLKENTTYIYAVESDGERSSIYSFHTMGKDGIKFIVYGDSRGVWDGWKNATRVAKSMEGKADVVISTGDMVRSGKDEEWIDFVRISSFMHNSSLYPCLGNHDMPFTTFQKYFSLPGNERWYSFDYGCAHFTVMDVCSMGAMSIPQILWLITDLNCKASWKFVVFHYPPYSSGEHGSTKILRLLVPLFKMKGVDVIFNGHDHDYEHVRAMSMTFIVTGGGGAPLYKVGSSPWTVFSSSSYHYCMIDATPHHLHLSVITPEGTLLEEFEMEK